MNAFKIYNLDKFDKKETGTGESDEQKNKRALKLASEMDGDEEEDSGPKKKEKSDDDDELFDINKKKNEEERPSEDKGAVLDEEKTISPEDEE